MEYAGKNIADESNCTTIHLWATRTPISAMDYDPMVMDEAVGPSVNITEVTPSPRGRGLRLNLRDENL
jgi:hypothetical protein